jgi:hypothetical protein
VLDPSILIAACASARAGMPIDKTPATSAGIANFCHNFMELTLVR